MRLLKKHSTTNDLQVFNTTDKEYIAYQVGLQLAADSSTATGSIQTTASSITVGTYTDTRYDIDLVSIISTSTTIYQNDTAANESGLIKTNTPIVLSDSDKVKNLSTLNADSDLNNLSDEILSLLLANEYPGSFRLGSTPPSGDWVTHISNVFADTTIAEGTVTQYNIYRRTTGTSPTKVRPFIVAYNDSDEPIGLKPSTDLQIKNFFTPRVENRILQSGIGKYQLRDNTQGVPTDPGTWATRGTAVDTRSTIVSNTYTIGGIFYENIFTQSLFTSYTLTSLYVLDVTYTTDPVYTLDTFTGVIDLYDGPASYAGPTTQYTGPGPVFYTLSVIFTGAVDVIYTGVADVLYTGSAAANYSSDVFTGIGAYESEEAGDPPTFPRYTGPGELFYTGTLRVYTGVGDVLYTGSIAALYTLSTPALYTLDIVYDAAGELYGGEIYDNTLSYTREGVGTINVDYIGPLILYTGSLLYDGSETYISDNIFYTGLVEQSPYTNDYELDAVYTGASTSYNSYIPPSTLIKTYTLYCRVA